MKIQSLILLCAGAIFTFSTCTNPTNKKIDTTQSINETEVTVNEPAVGLAIGNRAPELEYHSPDDVSLKLSSLRGKVVLIDFWASWCPPCRIENPHLVNSYHSFKDKKFKVGDGFTIYSVSLDQDKTKWIDAIKADKLVWKNHVSDLKGWKSVPAAMYQVRGIPGNFLIDGSGIILATDLRGEQLNEKLNELLK